MLSHQELSHFIRTIIPFAHQLADASGVVARRYFRTPVQVDDKNDQSPVTIADRSIEQTLRSMLHQHYPTHGIYGEEFGSEKLTADFIWVIDPIDGTKSFITGKPLFGTLIALTYQNRPILGVLDQPILQERWIGGLGFPTQLNGSTLKVRTCPSLSLAALYATTPHMFEGQDFDRFERVRKQAKFPLYGCDCYAYGLLSAGLVDMVIEASLKPYDYCALVPIIENAGGIITDWQGQPLTLYSDGRVLAAGDVACHAEALKYLKE